MTCKGVCVRYKAQKPRDESRYNQGQKRCSRCVIFMFWDGNNCPCCNTGLRRRPRNSKDRERHQKIETIQRM
jgi:hypothetical protein